MALVEKYTPDFQLDRRSYEEFLRLSEKVDRLARQLDAAGFTSNADGSVAVSSPLTSFTTTADGNGGQVITSYSAQGTQMQTGKLMTVSMRVDITTAGAANGAVLRVALPVPAAITRDTFGSGVRTDTALVLVTHIIESLPTVMYVYSTGFGGIIFNGAVAQFTITYPVA